MKEHWKEIQGMPEYKISNLGNVKSFLTDKISGKVLKPRKDSDGYLMVWTKYNSCAKIHRMVAKAFLPNPENYPVVNHIDGNKQKNNVENLEWCSISHNTKHSYALGLSHSAMSKPIEIIYKDEVISVFNSLRELSKYTNINRNTLGGYIGTNKPILDELFLKESNGNQKDNPLYMKEFLSGTLKRYQTTTCSYDDIYFESITELAKYLGISHKRCSKYLQVEANYNGKKLRKITRYEYLRIKFND